MKMVKKANGKKELCIKKSEWKNIGKKYGWDNDLFKIAENDIPHLLMANGTSNIADKVVKTTNLPLQTTEIERAIHPEDSRIVASSLINKILHSSDMVHVIKNVDRLIKVNNESQEYAKPILEWFLNTLESGLGQLNRNNIYVILMSDSDIGIDHNIPFVK